MFTQANKDAGSFTRNVHLLRFAHISILFPKNSEVFQIKSTSRGRNNMSLSDWANIAIIVQGIVIIVSLGFVFYQLRENARLTRAANTQKLVELTSPFALQLMQDRSAAELWVQGAHTWDTLDRR